MAESYRWRGWEHGIGCLRSIHHGVCAGPWFVVDVYPYELQAFFYVIENSLKEYFILTDFLLIGVIHLALEHHKNQIIFDCYFLRSSLSILFHRRFHPFVDHINDYFTIIDLS